MISQQVRPPINLARPGLPQNGDYILGHINGGVKENKRLDIQSEAIKHGIMNGRLVHEAVPMVNVQGSVADICCGTGAWLNDLAKEMAATDAKKQLSPTPIFVGFDLTATAFRSDLAPNVQLVRHDCCQPYPLEYVGKFDLVNMRGLAFAIPEAAFGELFMHACTLLKPGGYIQWLDTESQLWTSTPEADEFAEVLDLVMRERSRQGLVHYLNHGGASRPGATPGGCLNKAFSQIILGTMKLLLEASLIREQKNTANRTTMNSLCDVATLERCTQWVRAAQESGTFTVGGRFPLLIAQKVGPVPTDDRMVE